ncbi:MAG: hypothetical protein P8M11_15730 [Planctomycetota bacterium]|nr:hypothetical protein [Planctomycetota bacterium]MDG1986003.1 hypothetical protein [Planctomycetota bacterium]
MNRLHAQPLLAKSPRSAAGQRLRPARSATPRYPRRSPGATSPRTHLDRSSLCELSTGDLWARLGVGDGPLQLDGLRRVRDLLQERYFAALEAPRQRRTAG